MNARWQSTRAAGEIPPDRIIVWRVRLDREIEYVRSLAETLSSDEKSRAERFHFEQDRQRFIVARGTLRRVLAGYLETNPAVVRFRYGIRGKPALDETDSSGISFNVSHSHGLALFAICRGRNVGVDIEKIRTDFGLKEIAKRYFSVSECQELAAVPENDQVEAFFLCWTRKEAFIKALGEGLHSRLDSFGVTLRPNDVAAFTHGVAPQWRIEAFTATDQYPAAVVYDGEQRGIEFLADAESVAL